MIYCDENTTWNYLPFVTDHFHYTKPYKKDVHEPDNHDGVITHLEPDILECEVKWALGNIITNKASGGDGIPVELFELFKS